jgi:hypothetical protein
MAGLAACDRKAPAAPGATGAPATAAAGGAKPDVPHRTLKATTLFKSPHGYPNAIVSTPEGLYVAEQRTLTSPPSGVTNDIFLLDWQGKVLKTIKNESANTSGMSYSPGKLWIGNNARPQGILETDLDGKTRRLRQIPLGPGDNGGGCHGVLYNDGKVYINALRLKGILRVDAETWQPEFLIPYNFDRTHELAWDNGAIWMITGTKGATAATDFGGLAKYDAATGKLLETASLPVGAPDMHGLTIRDGVFYSCDASIHPGWKDHSSPGSGYIFRLDFV